MFAYFYLWLGAPAWPPSGSETGDWMLPLLALGLLLAVLPTLRLLRAGQSPVMLRIGLLGAATLVAGASMVQLAALAATVAPPQQHAYASVVWTLAGYHAAHVLVAILITGFVWARSRFGLITAERTLEPRIAAAALRYCVGLGLVAWALIHLVPRWL